MDDGASKANGSFTAIESIGKVLLASGAICYVVGIVVVNFHLRALGFSDYSLLRTRFIFTGVITLLPLVVIGYTVFAAKIVASRNKNLLLNPEDKGGFGCILRKFYAAVQFVGVIILGLSSLSLFTLTGWAVNTLEYHHDILIGAAVIINVSLLKIIDKYRKQNTHIGINSPPNKNHARQRVNSSSISTVNISVSDVTILIVTLLVYLFVYTAFVFPEVPDQFGGGKSKLVQLVLFDDFVVEGGLLGIDMEDNSHRSVPVPLLWEGEDAYLIFVTDSPVPGEPGTAQIDKSMVAGMLVAPFGPPKPAPPPFGPPPTSTAGNDRAPSATPVRN